MTSLNSLLTAPATPRRAHVTLRTKITIPYLILSLVLAVAVAFLTTRLVVENLEERFNKQLFEAGKISSELLVGYEAELLETQRMLANLDGTADALESRDLQRLRRLVVGVLANDRVEAVEFLDVDGNLLLSLHHRQGGNPENYEALTGGRSELANQVFVRNVLLERSDEKGNKYAGRAGLNDQQYLYVAGPVRDRVGRMVGVVLVGRSLATLAADMHARTFGQITFYDSEGRVLESTLPVPPSELPLEIMRQTILDSATSSRRRELQVVDTALVEILGAWEVRGGEVLGVLGIALSENAVVQASAGSRLRIFLLVAVGNILILLIGFGVANAITRPLVQLMKAALRVSDGDLTVHVDALTGDEIGILTESFNSMVARISQSRDDLLQAYGNTLEGWAKALELRHKEVEGHSARVTSLTLRLASALGIQQEELVDIRRGALLHDIGKLAIPDSILLKDGPLTEREINVVRRHPLHAYGMLKKIPFLRPALAIPVCHHEKWDGTGYPHGLKGDAIPLPARIFAVVDVWDSLTSDRPYRKALPHEDVIAHLIHERGRHFDPRVVDAFLPLVQPGAGGLR